MNTHKLAKDFENWIKRHSGEDVTKVMYNVCYSRYYNSGTEDCWQAYLAAHNAQQAVIDRLMLEFCYDEMSPEQLKDWGDSQRRVKDTVQQSHTVDEWGVESGWVTYTAKEISELKNEPCGYGYRREYREITEGKS